MSPAEDASTPAIDADAQLMLEVAAGSEAAFVQLMERWQRPLINYFYRSLQSVADAEDLAQMVFVRLHRAADRYEPRAKFSTYLFHIARRLMLNEFRRRKRKPAEPVDPIDLRDHAQTEGPGETREIETAFLEALEDLPEKHRTAILLYQQQGLSYAEIGESMGATESAIKTWIFRARQKLKDALKDYYDNAS